MEKLFKNRLFSFAAVVFVYVLAAIVGILFYKSLPFSYWINLLVADVLATLFVFLFSIIFSNASVYDPYWSVQPIVIVLAYSFGARVDLLGILLISVICLWGVRLTANWAYVFGDLTHEDWRYIMLREKTGAVYPIINFVGIHLVPTLVVYGCTLPAVYALRNGGEVNALTVVFLSVSVLAVVLQAVSDIQMQSFRKAKPTPFIRKGIWKYSRHPNYLGEILMWWGVALAVVSVFPSAWYLIAGALTNTLLFTFVSIPMAEGRQSRKAGYEEYKAQTRVLLPIKRKASH